MFEDCEALGSVDMSSLDTSSVNLMSSLFDGCTNLKKVTFGGSFTTAGVTDGGLEGMLSGCSSLKSLDLSQFVTTNAGDMNYMFSNCSSLTSLTLPYGFCFSGFTDLVTCTGLKNVIITGTSEKEITDPFIANFNNKAKFLTDCTYNGTQYSERIAAAAADTHTAINSIYSYCYDTDGTVYLVYHFTGDPDAYDAIEIQDKTDNNARIEPSKTTEAYPFTTVYKKVKIGDKTIEAASDDEYLIAIKIDNANAVTSNTAKFAFVPINQ